MNADRNRMHFLDGLRGWGAVVVFYYHLFSRFLGQSFPEMNEVASRTIFLDGHLAVLVFFVVSGVSLSLGPLKAGEAAVISSLLARYFRLMIPVLATTALIFAFMRLGWMYNLEVAETGLSREWIGRFYTFTAYARHMLQFATYDVFFNYVSEKSFNSSLWTLAYEMAGSMGLYLFLLTIKSTLTRRGVAVALTAVLLIFKPYLACFFAGFLIADLLLHAQFRFPHGSLVGAVLICLAIVAACFYRPRSDAYWSIVSVMIVTGSAICAPVQRFFASGLSRALGTISFPLYLSHILVICSLSSFLYLELPSYGLGPVAALMANLGATTVASGLLAIALVPLETLSIFASRAISRMIMLLDHSLGEKGRLPTRAELLACVRSQLPR